MVRTSLDSGYLPLTALQDAKTCQDTIIFEDLFASFDVMIIINKEAPAQGADCKARDALHECQQTKRPEKHVDGSCQTLRQQLQGWQNTSTGSNTDNQGKNWWLSMDAQSNTDRIPCKESQDITSDSMSDSFLCDWIQLRSTKPGFWSLSSSEASFRANTQTNKALLDESVVSFANIHNCNVCTLHRNLLAIRTSLTLIQIHDYLIHTIPLVWTDRLWCCPGQLSKSHEAEKYRIEGQQEYDNFDNWSNCHHHVQVVYPISPELASEKKDARNHVQDKHGCKKHIARRKCPSRGRRREWQGIGRALARLLKWAWWLGVFFCRTLPWRAERCSAEKFCPMVLLAVVIHIYGSLFDDLFGERFVTNFYSFQGAKCRVWKGRSRLCAHLARRFIWSRLLISNTSCGLICAYASWQVSMSHCVRGLPTLIQCSIRGLRVPGSNKTSLMGSSCWALRMWPNNLVLLFFHLVDSFVCEYLKRCSRVSMTFWFVHSLSTKVVGTRGFFLTFSSVERLVGFVLPV